MGTQIGPAFTHCGRRYTTCPAAFAAPLLAVQLTSPGRGRRRRQGLRRPALRQTLFPHLHLHVRRPLPWAVATSRCRALGQLLHPATAVSSAHRGTRQARPPRAVAFSPWHLHRLARPRWLGRPPGDARTPRPNNRHGDARERGWIGCRHRLLASAVAVAQRLAPAPCVLGTNHPPAHMCPRPAASPSPSPAPNHYHASGRRRPTQALAAAAGTASSA